MIHPLEIGSLCSHLHWTKSALLLFRHNVKIIGIRAEIKITQNQDCVLLKLMYCPSNDCMQWAYVRISPSCYMHCNHCLMDYYLSTICCKTVRNISLCKFQFNCFLCWWPYFFIYILKRWWSAKGLVGRFQTLLKKPWSASLLLDHTLIPLTVMITQTSEGFPPITVLFLDVIGRA